MQQEHFAIQTGETIGWQKTKEYSLSCGEERKSKLAPHLRHFMYHLPQQCQSVEFVSDLTETHSVFRAALLLLCVLFLLSW